MWCTWTGARRTEAEPVQGEHQLYSFPTCAPNALVAPIHPKAMPVILTTAEEMDA
ncbi:putative SOS response-associated peptidase YedK [Amorphus suaedae]